MKNGNDEQFRIYMCSHNSDMEQLKSNCKTISDNINCDLENSADPRPLTNPVKVYVSSYTHDQPESKSNIWISVNSSWKIAERARMELATLGYKTGNII